MGNFKNAAFAAILFLFPAIGNAALLDLDDLGYERDTVVFGGGAISTSVIANMSVFASDAYYTTILDIIDLNDPSTAGFFRFGTSPADELSKTGVSAQAEMAGTLQLLFENVLGTGTFASFNGHTILAELSAPGLDTTQDLDSNQGTLTLTALRQAKVDMPAIPLPATGLMLLTALAGLTWIRRS